MSMMPSLRRTTPGTEYVTIGSNSFRVVGATAAAPAKAAPKRSKYGNRHVIIGSERFDSEKEGRRWLALKALEKGCKISQLERQVVFELAPKVRLHGEKRTRPAIRYIADFRYFDAAKAHLVVEDTKGHDTPVSRMKRHLMKTVLGIDVVLS